jgi:putative transposase
VPLLQPKTTVPQVLSKALNTTLKHSNWGGQKLSAYLLLNGFSYLSPATLNRIKKRLKGLVKEKGLKIALSYQFVENNNAWCLDFLEFIWGLHKLYILTILDDTSRYLLNWTITTEPTTELVKELLRETFLLFGTPKLVKTDNGPQFRQELSNFLKKLEIEHYPSPYWTPQFNGKTERQNKELRVAADLAAKAARAEDVVAIIGRSFYEYNYIRPHQALEGLTPYMCYSGLEDELKARMKVFKEQELQKKQRMLKRTIWLPGDPDPEYLPRSIILPGQPPKNLTGLIVPIRSKVNRKITVGYVRQSLGF